MSGIATSSMSREKIQQLLKALGTGPMDDAEQVEATEYDWHESHYFNGDQLEKLNNFTDAIAEAMTRKFNKFCRGEFEVTVASITQHYVNNFLSKLSDSEQKDYYIPFCAGAERMCGLIGMPEQVVFDWARQLLGDSESDKNHGRDLSQLEESLLLDLVSALIEVFSDLDESFDFNSEKNIIKGRWPLELDGTEELCKISFNVKKTGSEKGSEAYFLILCNELEPVAGKAVQDSVCFSEEDVSKAILGHLYKMPVPITGQLASAMLTFEEIMNLQVDDILLLDEKIDHPMELIVGGRTFYYGHPAKSTGKYAVTITDTTAAFGDTAEI
jgi:flagellar motor switch protein FliM